MNKKEWKLKVMEYRVNEGLKRFSGLPLEKKDAAIRLLNGHGILGPNPAPWTKETLAFQLNTMSGEGNVRPEDISDEELASCNKKD